jgi:Protein of unknown function (DUF3303)
MQVYDESGRLPMLFIVIERFKNRDTRAVSERFRRLGRMFPDGVAYHASWVDSAGARCFQLMEAPDPESVNLWASLWDDLIEFEIVPVQTSDDFWSTFL